MSRTTTRSWREVPGLSCWQRRVVRVQTLFGAGRTTCAAACLIAAGIELDRAREAPAGSAIAIGRIVCPRCTQPTTPLAIHLLVALPDPTVRPEFERFNVSSTKVTTPRAFCQPIEWNRNSLGFATLTANFHSPVGAELNGSSWRPSRPGSAGTAETDARAGVP